MSGTVVLREKWPVIGRHEQAVTWLQIWTNLGRAPLTIDAYARGLAEYLPMCEREGVDPVTANRAHVAVFVRELTSRPSLRGANVVGDVTHAQARSASCGPAASRNTGTLTRFCLPARRANVSQVLLCTTMWITCVKRRRACAHIGEMLGIPLPGSAHDRGLYLGKHDPRPVDGKESKTVHTPRRNSA